jgi:hypothetical protein
MNVLRFMQYLQYDASDMMHDASYINSDCTAYVSVFLAFSNSLPWPPVPDYCA